MRVRWTDEERAVLIEQAANLIHCKQVFSLRDALVKSQEVLPKDRRRNIAALTQVPWFVESVPAKVKELDHQHTKAVEEEVQQAVQSSEQKAREQLEDQIAQYIGKILARALSSAIKSPELAVLFHPPPINHEPMRFRLVQHRKEKLPRVVVAGLLNSQTKVVESGFNDRLDLRFWSKDQSPDTLKSMLSHADAAVGMVSFLAHSHDSILKASKVPYTPVSGGVTQIKQALERLLETV